MKTAPMRFGYRFVAWLVRTALRVLFGLRIRGRENVPLRGTLILVSNHVAAIDPVAIGSVVPREIHFAAKRELFKGLVGKLITYLNAVPIRRSGSDKQAIRTLTGVLRNGGAILIFPEGTRRREANLQEYKGGVGMLAMMGGADMLPLRVDGSKNLKKTLLRRSRLQVTFGRLVPLAPLIEDDPPRKEAYRRIAEAVMAEVIRLRDEG